MTRSQRSRRGGRAAEAARWAAWLFAASGVLALVGLLAPATGEREASVVAALALADLLAAVAILRRSPEDWGERGLVAIGAGGLTLVFLFALSGAVPTFGYPTFFLLLFAWIGSALPRGSALRFAVPAGVAYVIPLLVHDAPAALVASVVVLLPVMVLVAEVIAAAVGRLEELNGRLLDASRSDELTGIGNRRRADELIKGLAPGDGVIMIDLDHFKQVNDLHGHAAGDEVLTRLGSHLRGTVRGEDVVARYGGEEFLVVAPRAGEHAIRVAERIVEAWRAAVDAPTLSVGVAVNVEGEAPVQTLRRADAAVYAAKRAGRDQIQVADSAGPLSVA